MGVMWGPLTWRHLDAGPATELWIELIDWVDWLRDRYELEARQIPPCWPNHPVAVEELTALMASYTAAYRALTTRDGDVVRYHDTMIVWHRLELWSCLARLADHADTTVCSDGQCAHRRPSPRPVTMSSETSRAVIDADLAARPIGTDARTLTESVMSRLVEQGIASAGDDGIEFDGATWHYNQEWGTFHRHTD